MSVAYFSVIALSGAHEVSHFLAMLYLKIFSMQGEVGLVGSVLAICTSSVLEMIGIEPIYMFY